MTNNTTPLVDEHLLLLEGAAVFTTDDHFYIRLKARMEREKMERSWFFSIKPAWAFAVLFLLLGINGFIVFEQGSSRNEGVLPANPVADFAEFYNLTLSQPYTN